MPAQSQDASSTLSPAVIRWLISIALLALVALSWSRYLDDAAQAATLSNFKRALTAAAMARAFNGIISVAQGTEIAVQPVGVGVTLTIGEVLDPLNDLVERFAWLALVASVSLGLQMTLGDMLASPWLSGFMTVAIITYLVLLWRAPAGEYAARVSRWIGAVIFLRFLLAVVLLATYLLDTAFLAARQDAAMAALSQTSHSIEALQNESSTAASMQAEETDFLDTLGSIIDSSRQQLDLEAQLEAVEEQVEASVEEMINLIVIFLLQTVLLPVATLWVCWLALKAFWRRTTGTG